MLAFIRYDHSTSKNRYNVYECSYCNCKVVRQQRKVLGDSCGCHQREARVIHGHDRKGRRTPELNTFRHMWERCTSVSCSDWPNYGGRGIRVCDRWKDFTAFFIDMGLRPPGTSIDRIDNNGDYAPDNCRWATTTQQRRNKRNCRYITVRGVTKTLVEWRLQARLSKTHFYRLNKTGLSAEQIISGRLSAGGEG